MIKNPEEKGLVVVSSIGDIGHTPKSLTNMIKQIVELPLSFVQVFVVSLVAPIHKKSLIV